jgi:UDP-N-acetyl-D-mannosaminuronic acid transferase (WecB/TagA/CpsF family)
MTKTTIFSVVVVMATSLKNCIEQHCFIHPKSESVKGAKKNKKLFLLGSKNGTSQNTEYEVQKICTIILTRKANFSQPKFLPFFSINI